MDFCYDGWTDRVPQKAPTSTKIKESTSIAATRYSWWRERVYDPLHNMDALSGYGSDDSDRDACNQPTSSKPQETGGLSGLLGDYSDDDDDDNDAKAQNAAINGAGGCQSSTGEPSLKRQRLSEVTRTHITYRFSPPPTSSGESLVEWSTDYLTAKQEQHAIKIDSLVKITSTKLQQISVVSNNKAGGWAQQLKTQHDFNNPHMFESVVELSGIANELGSNLSDVADFSEWEYSVVAHEEQTRIREQQEFQQEQASTSQFAQEQLQRAMQRGPG